MLQILSSCRALSKIGSVATIQPPEQMCEKIKGSLIKKQVIKS
jgi:hypothetical protein